MQQQSFGETHCRLRFWRTPLSGEFTSPPAQRKLRCVIQDFLIYTKINSSPEREGLIQVWYPEPSVLNPELCLAYLGLCANRIFISTLGPDAMQLNYCFLRESWRDDFLGSLLITLAMCRIIQGEAKWVSLDAIFCSPTVKPQPMVCP